MHDNLAGDIYNQVRDDNETRVFECWHASSIADCPRCHYLKRLGQKELVQSGAGKMLRWKAGHLIEEVVRPYLLALYPDMLSNVRFTSATLDLTGEYDNYSEKEKTIFEIKSVHDFAFAYNKSGTGRYHIKGEKPYLNHELQNHCYVRLMRDCGFPVDWITYVYITLDGRIATYKTAVKEELLLEVDRILNELNTAWKTKVPPRCICHDEGNPLYKLTVQYCGYRNGDKCCEVKGE